MHSECIHENAPTSILKYVVVRMRKKNSGKLKGGMTQFRMQLFNMREHQLLTKPKFKRQTSQTITEIDAFNYFGGGKASQNWQRFDHNLNQLANMLPISLK